MAADAAIWGYIEGYYGRLPSWEDRAFLLARLSRLGANAYLYAPKEDPLHRRDWRKPYGPDWRRRFARFAAQGRRGGVDVIPGLAPGLSFDYLSRPDYAALLAKFRAFLRMGCRTLALLMDDIPPELPERSRGKFRSLGHAHGLMLSHLLRDLGRGEGRKGSGIRLWFCPTVYTDQFARGPVGKDPYLADLAALMPPSVTLMWTGPGIISERLAAPELRAVSRRFRGNVVIWDNVYANDYCPNKLFAGPYRGRPAALWSLTRGVLLNPTGMPHTDAFLLSLLAACRRGDQPGPAWKRALEEAEVPSSFRQAARFLDSPFFRPESADLTADAVASLRAALKPLIWDWKSPLHREWYPYLFMLDADLKACLKGRDRPDAAWLRKRYSPVMARLLLDARVYR